MSHAQNNLRQVLESLRFSAHKLLGEQIGEAVEHLDISAGYCDYEDAPWEIKVQSPDGITHAFGGFDPANSLRNLERFGIPAIRKSIGRSVAAQAETTSVQS